MKRSSSDAWLWSVLFSLLAPIAFKLELWLVTVMALAASLITLGMTLAEMRRSWRERDGDLRS